MAPPPSSGDALQVSAILMGLLGGLALFLYGMDKLTGALKVAAGGGMKRLLARLTTNRFKAAAAGAAVTAVIQSSSVTTVLVVGFLSAGLMTLSQSVGIIMGANIGTTITAQIIAFKITKYALAIIAVGFALLFLTKKEKLVQYGAMIMGLGLLFFGMDLMGDAAQPLRSYEPFIDAMRSMESRGYGILIGAVFTALIQSSSAATGVIIVLASQGFITLEAGIALAFGANIGTCVTALLAAIGKPRDAVRAAIVHVLFNVLGVLVWLAFIDQLAWIVRAVSPTSPPALIGVEKLAAETPRQIANAHTLFNVANTVVFIGFTRPIAWIASKIVPDRPPKAAGVQPKYLDDILLETPALALDRVRLELGRLGDRSSFMVRNALPVALSGSREELRKLARLDDDIDTLHGYVLDYLGRLSRRDLGSDETLTLQQYVGAANSLENIGDMIETNVVEAGLERLRSDVTVSPATREVLGRLHDRVCRTVEDVVRALIESDAQLALAVIDAKPAVSALADEAERHLAFRLAVEVDERIKLFRIESEMIEYLKRVYYFAKRIAKGIAEAESERHGSSSVASERVDT